MIIGIDLGTTNSLVGVWKDGRAELIPNALGSLLTPSAVHVDKDGLVHVGMVARERLSTHPAQTMASFKRYMGTNRQFKLGDTELSAIDLSALLLRSLKADAEKYLQSPVHEAIITVPAYFNDFQRKATKAAAELAGLRVERLLNEPTAAALAYGVHEEAGERKILVLDLGGGTFDVSILEVFDGIMEVRASAGDNRLGGDDFTELIMDAFIAEVGIAAGIPSRMLAADIHGPLRHQAELVKRRLSDAQECTMELIFREQKLQWKISRERFEALCAPLIQRTRLPIERAIRDAALMPDDITHLVLAGGATRMPIFANMVSRLFQRLPAILYNPDEVVAMGAAVQAGLKMRDGALDDVVMTDVAPFTLGISIGRERVDGVQIGGLFASIIDRNTVIPASRSKKIPTTRKGQTFVRVSVFQGEGRLISENILLGELSIPVPPAPAGVESIDVRFTYDVSGLLEVEARNSLNQVVRLLITSHSGMIDEAEIAARFETLAELKNHPRDEVENQTVLARAQRLYEGRLGPQREAVGMASTEFQLTLERQDKAEIAAHRQRLHAWLESIDPGFFL